MTEHGKEILNILIVEDDPDDLYIVKGMLTNLRQKVSFEISWCREIGAAQKIVADQDIDVILLDLNLPDSIGLETLETLRNVCEQPVIVLTGNEDDEIGVSAIQSGAADFLPKTEINSLVLNRSITYAIERQYFMKELQRQASTDELTGLASRTHFMSRLDMMVEQVQRSGAKLALALLDLDDFKPINDTFGHSAGDKVLIHIARRLKDKLRTSDMAARFGGDEFMVMFLNYDQQESLQEVIVKKVAQLTSPLKIKNDKGELEIKVGVSVGLAEWQKGMTAQELLNKADALMYQSKARGKNTVTMDIGPN